ncbi:50S ribosomal protein L29 [Rubrobacter xylanophilus DSM 9941]|uniref:Large ribosomal subunit protein uL29 n=1 Tax=Rubrobacter xylanophilus TaxID=49319 RepID=A0A510HHU5_9ACTN|nr:50S ribosomal protein L29 [Rubrobacter xylanophilus]QYJ15307.1 50S ribosomal protein L29 [Rubrobacter xylanophilus DSM 9941]BBL79576.1 50S ribosomal protein L29 [Rubrobacter xylanophilus]
MVRLKTRELRELDVEEIERRLAETRRELFNLRFQHATGQLENTGQLREVRRNIARLLTVLNQKRQESSR